MFSPDRWSTSLGRLRFEQALQEEALTSFLKSLHRGGRRGGWEALARRGFLWRQTGPRWPTLLPSLVLEGTGWGPGQSDPTCEAPQYLALYSVLIVPDRCFYNTLGEVAVYLCPRPWALFFLVGASQSQVRVPCGQTMSS